MSSLSARIWKQQLLRYVPHTSVSGETWQCTRMGTCTGAGAAGGTTVVDSNSGGSNDDYNGRYWIEILSGDNKGQWKRVVDYVAASGTFTLENNGYSAQVASGVQYRLWLSPEPVVVVDSSSGATNMVDAVRAEANDFWNGYYAMPITGSRRGEIAEITDHVSGSGTFTLGSGLSGALTAGDVVLIGRFVESPAQPSLTHEYIPVPGNRVNFSMGDGVLGPRGGSFAFNSRIYGSGALSGDGSAAGSSVLSGLFEAAGLEEVTDTSDLSNDPGAANTTTSIIVDDGTSFTPGQMIVHNGNATFITSISSNTLTVSPPLPSAPADNDVIYASRGYIKSVDGDTLGCTIELEIDGVRTTMTGCKGNVTLQDGAAPELAWAFSVDHWVREAEAAPYNPGTAYTTVAPIVAQDRKAYVGTTATNVGVVTATPGTQVVPKNVQGSAGVNGRVGYHISDYQAGLTCQELLDSSSATLPQEERWLERASNIIALVYGSHGNTFAVRVPAARHVESPHPTEQDNLAAVPDVFAAHDAGTATDGNGNTVKMPDFGFFLT